ncbi:MAG: hypothetical protein WCO54_03365 [Bacteroidota bacterium]
MKYFTVVVFLFAIILSGCKPNSDLPCRLPVYYQYSFSSTQNLFPFTGSGDTARYINTAGDTIWCFGSTVVKGYKCNPFRNNPECPDDSLAYAIWNYSFSDTLGKFNFSATASIYDTTLKITANTSYFKIPLGNIGYNDSLTWFDSLKFGNKMFYNLQSFVNNNGDSLYYNSSYGIIGLKQASQRIYIYRFRNY